MQQNTGDQENPMAQVEMQQAIQDLMTCHSVCIQTVKNDLKAGGEHAQDAHIHMLEDCADLCQTAAHFLQHSNPLYGYVTQAAYQVTNHCQEECERMGDTECANACKNAAWAMDQVNKMVAF